MPVLIRRLFGGYFFILLFHLTTSISLACEISVNSLNFGVIDPDRGESARATINVTCKTATNFDIGLTSQTSQGARMLSGPNGGILRYQIFSDPTLSVPWGNDDSIGPVITGSNDGSNATKLTLYGELFKKQAGVPPGNYSDPVVITLTF